MSLCRFFAIRHALDGRLAELGGDPLWGVLVKEGQARLVLKRCDPVKGQVRSLCFESKCDEIASFEKLDAHSRLPHVTISTLRIYTHFCEKAL